MILLNRKRIYRIAISIVAVLIVIVSIELYFRYLSFFPKTDDAYLEANYIKGASLVSGKIAIDHINNNQAVKKGEVLFSLDTKPLQIEVNAAQAQVELIKQKLAAATLQIAAARAELEKAAIELNAMQQQVKGTIALVREGDLPEEDAKLARTRVKAAQAQYRAAEFKLKEAQRAAGSAEVNENPELKIAEAAYQGAQYKLEHAQYIAPVNGIIVNKKFRVGDLVGAGQPLFVLIDSSQYWIVANFSEKKLSRIKVGQAVKISIDMYSEYKISGIVEDINFSSGASYSLLPAQNASGNWVKVAQRFPVKIKITNPPNGVVAFRVGASCSVTVDTRS
jgi:membrane fusion protein (multidrug efflux system)